MTSRAIIRQTDLKRMAAVARAEGVAVEIEQNGVKVRIVPDGEKKPVIDEREVIRL